MIVLHILGPGNFMLERMVCVGLVAGGIDAVLVKMPYYEKRRPKGVRLSPETSLDAFIAGVQQGVHDVRRTAAWLASSRAVGGYFSKALEYQQSLIGEKNEN